MDGLSHDRLAARAPATIARLIDAVDGEHVKRSLSNIYVSRKYGYLFHSNPKAACSSIKHKLFELEAPASVAWKGRMSVHAQEFSPLLGLPHFLHDSEAAARPIYSFCFVRNPFSRLFSAYTDKIRGGMSHKRQIERVLGLPEQGADVEISFRDFIRAIQLMDDDALDGHWAIQTQRLRYDRFAFSFTGAFERLAEDLPRALKGAGVDKAEIGVLSRRNRSSYDQTIMDVMDEETAAMIRERYADDFALLGYSGDPADAAEPPAP
ncbi:MAG: sulfotransferase family 2 domain-containing protein [Pseudomonadota bacterium]